MNKIKSLFIGIFPMFAMGVSFYGVYYLLSSGMNYIWLGAVLTTMPIILFISRVMLFRNLARTTSHFPLLTSIAHTGLLISLYGYSESIYSPTEIAESNYFNNLSFSLACIGYVSYMLYNFWYSSLGRDLNPILQIGKTLPKFELSNIQGDLVDSESFKGSPTIFMFFRGNWCPLCMAQIKEISAKYREISSLGAKVVLCAPQPEKNTQSLADKFDVPFLFMTDTHGRAARELDIEMKNGLPAGMELLGYDKDTVYPTVIITDKQGRIIYSDLTNNYRVRPEPDDFIKVLNSQQIT